jgi:hypothetical protein
MTVALAATARAYRRAIGKHAFSEQHLVVLDFILFYSLERGCLKALIPKQNFFARLRGLDEGDVSKAIKWLRLQNVIEVEGDFFSLLPPGGWTAPVRIRETQETRALEDWLERVEPDQPELLPPDQTLNDAHREVFVESSRESQSSRVESTASSWTGSKSSPVGENPTGRGKVGDFPTKVGEFPTQEPAAAAPPSEPVGDFPTARARVDRSIDSDRLIDSRSSTPRIDRSIEGAGKVGDFPTVPAGPVPPPTGGEYRAYVEQRLFQVIGQDERFGRMRETWYRALQVVPDQVDELIGVALEKKRLGQFTRTKSTNPMAAWLNASVRTALQGWYARAKQ